MKRIGDFAIEYMKENNMTIIGYNEYGALDEVWYMGFKAGVIKQIGSRGGRNNPHPINKQNVVLASLARDKRFTKFYIRCCDRNGRSERLVREFELKKDKP